MSKNLLTLDIAPCGAVPDIDTVSLFSIDDTAPKLSPIDEFLNRLTHTNKLVPNPASFDHIHAQLLLLGTVAAVESYLRGILRHTINIDVSAREKAYEQSISFAAATHLSVDLMPEAIFERTSFIGRKSVWEESLHKIIGIPGPIPPGLDAAIQAYERVCQLRHCIVHRFGRLGANNAVQLGMAKHGPHSERPIIMTYSVLQTCFLACETLVRTVNNIIFRTVLGRIPRHQWKRAKKSPPKWFTTIYALFCVSRGTQPSPTALLIYQDCARVLGVA